MKAQLRSLKIGGAPAGLRHKCLAAIFISILGMTSLGLQAQETPAAGGVRKTAGPAQMAPVRTIAFSPDGTSLLAGGGPKDRAGQVTLWNLATRNPVWWASLPRGVYSSAFAPDGKKLAVAFSQSEMRLLDPATGKLLGTLKGPAKGVQPVAFSFDGKTLAAGGLDGAIVLWDVASGQTRLTVPAHKGNIYSLAFSPDGKWLVSGGEDYTARLWSVATGKQEARCRDLGASCLASPFHPTAVGSPQARGTGHCESTTACLADSKHKSKTARSIVLPFPRTAVIWPLVTWRARRWKFTGRNFGTPTVKNRNALGT